MQQIIYADVLVIINMFVTYGMLRLTGIICRSEKRQIAMFLSSLLSGFYSLIIIIPDISDFAVALSRLPVSVGIILLSFSVYNLRHFLRLFACFFAVNFIFAGIMFALWFFFSPKGMYFNNGIVYFNINIEMLAILVCVCYFLTLLFSKLISFSAPVNTVYELQIFLGGRSCSMKAFHDTGNCLKDVFTGYPIIVANKASVQKLFDCEISSESEKDGVPLFRPILCNTVSGSEMLLSFKVDKIRIRGVKCDFERDKVHVAITDKTIKNGDFSALIGSAVFENQIFEKGDDYLVSIFKNSDSYTKGHNVK